MVLVSLNVNVEIIRYYLVMDANFEDLARSLGGSDAGDPPALSSYANSNVGTNACDDKEELLH